MPNLKKEQFLHKVVAASGFLFALCILPLAQYALNNSGNGSDNSVAGVTTTASPQNTIQAADVAQPVSPAVCEATKQKDLSNLQLFYDGKKKNLLATYESSVAGYKAAETALTGTPESIATEKASLDKLIDDQYQPYLKNLTAVDAAVNASKTDIQNRSCE